MPTTSVAPRPRIETLAAGNALAVRLLERTSAAAPTGSR